MERLTGTVREVVKPVTRWEAERGDDKLEGTQDGELDVEHAGGLVRVHVRGRDLRADPARRTVAWGDVAEQYGLARGETPPYTEVRFEVSEVAVGAQVAFAGEVVEQAFSDDGGLREQPSTRPRVVRAAVLATGEDALRRVERELARREEARREEARRAAEREAPSESPWLERVVGALLSVTAAGVAELVMLALALALFVIAGVVASGGGADRAAFGFACGVLALAVCLRPSKQLHRFHARERPLGRVVHLGTAGRCVAFAFGVFPLAMGLGIATGAVPTGPGGEREGAPVTAAFGLILVGALGLGEIIAHPTVRRLSALARRDAVEGAARAHRPEKVGDHAAIFGRVETWDSVWTTNANNKSTTTNRLLSARFASAPSFTIEADAVTIDVETSDIAWASTSRARIDGRPWQILMLGVVGDRVVANGPRDGDRLRARGTEPVLVLAGPEAPRQWAARQVRWRWFSRAVLVACVPALLWASGWLG